MTSGKPGAGTDGGVRLAFFDQIWASSPEPTTLHDANHVVIAVNPAFERLFGYAPDEIVGKRLSEMIAPPGREDELGEIASHLSRGEPVSLRTVRRNRDGLEIAVRLTAFAVSHDGERAGFVTIYRDETEVEEQRRALAQAERKYRGIFENAVEGIFMTSSEGRYLDANPSLARIYGFADKDELISHFESIGDQLYVRAGRRDEYQAIMERDGEVWNFESEIYRKDGSVIWISENSRAVRDENGELLYYEGTVVDITEERRAREEAEKQRSLFRQLFESSPLAIVCVDESHKVVDVNPAYETLFGYLENEMRGRLNREVIVPKDLSGEAEAINRAVFGGNHVQTETTREAKGGRRVPVSLVGYPIALDGGIVGAYYIYDDITQRREYEDQITHQAFHDGLTGLPNRLLFSERLDRAVKRSMRRGDYNFAVLMIDLNRFKMVNDTMGHQAGDELLTLAAERMGSCVRSVDTVARLGGDEFAILLEEYARPSDVTRVALRISRAMEEPFDLRGNSIVISASIGIVLKTRGYTSAETILRDADIAMYRAKEMDRVPYKIFNRRMFEQAAESLLMENELRRALAENELTVHYQPIVSAKSRALKGFEALVRWNHPRLGLVPPDRFLPLAQETGLILPLDRWVLCEALDRLARWRDDYPSRAQELTMSVNVSEKLLMSSEFPAFLRQRLDQACVPPERLKLELVETALINDSVASANRLLELKSIGVNLVIDDFGTGYSSLNYLQRLPIDMLKIDRSFISGPDNRKEKNEIVKTIIALARNLGLCVVAEGVEDDDQLQGLINQQCDLAQGFMFSKAVAPEAAEKLIIQEGDILADK